MASNAPLIFTLFTDPRILFANVDAANNFFASCYVTLTGENIPPATSTTYGGVKQMTLSNYAPPASSISYLTINTGDESVQVPSHDAYVALEAKVEAMNVSLSQLMTQLISQGYVAS